MIKAPALLSIKLCYEVQKHIDIVISYQKVAMKAASTHETSTGMKFLMV